MWQQLLSAFTLTERYRYSSSKPADGDRWPSHWFTVWRACSEQLRLTVGCATAGRLQRPRMIIALIIGLTIVQVTTLLPADDKAVVPRTTDGAIDYSQVGATCSAAHATCNKQPADRSGGGADGTYARLLTAAQDFFGKKAFMTVSGQLSVENYCCSLSNVYATTCYDTLWLALPPVCLSQALRLAERTRRASGGPVPPCKAPHEACIGRAEEACCRPPT